MEGGGEGAWEGRGEGWMEEGCHFCLYCQDWVGLKASLQQLSPRWWGGDGRRGREGEGAGSLESRLTILQVLSCSFGKKKLFISILHIIFLKL